VITTTHERRPGVVSEVGAEAPLETRGTSKAWMTPRDADLLESILWRAAERFRGALHVLEWGSGLSTLYYPAWLARRGARVVWTALEHDRELFHRWVEPGLRQQGATVVRYEDLPDAPADLWASAQPGVIAVVFDKGPIVPFEGSPTRDADRAKNLDDYIGLPARLGVRQQVFLVDGRKRRRCLGQAAGLLDAEGVALLHDAQRPYYHPAFAAFRSGRRIGDELWIGAQSDMDFADLVPGFR
jgi:hypothetical protein